MERDCFRDVLDHHHPKSNSSHNHFKKKYNSWGCGEVGLFLSRRIVDLFIFSLCVYVRERGSSLSMSN